MSKITGKRNVGNIAYLTLESYEPPTYEDFEVKVMITKEIIAPKWERGEEYHYFCDVLAISNNAPENPIIIGNTPGKNLRKNPKLGKKFWIY